MVSNSRTERKRARRDAIVDAAVTLFSDLGYAGTSMQAIADAAGCSVGVLYKHFDRKEALLDAVIQAVMERLEARIREEAPRAGREALARFRSSLSAGAETLAADPRLVRLLHAQEGVIHRRLRETSAWMRDRDRTLLDEAVAAGELQKLDTGLLVAVIDGAAWELFIKFGMEAPERIREVPDLVDEFILAPLCTANGDAAVGPAAKGTP